MRRITLLLFTLICVGNALAKTRLPITETIEWTWSVRPDNPTASLPNVLLVGDSITRGYYPETVKQLQGVANVYLYATSVSSGDPRFSTQLRDYFKSLGLQFAVIHFNNGMHGWGYTEQQYASGLPGMIAALRAGSPHAILEWASTTPVLHDSVNGESSNARIDERNQLAWRVMEREGIPIDDQHTLMLKHPDLHDGDVHFTAEGSALQAAQVSAKIREDLGKR